MSKKKLLIENHVVDLRLNGNLGRDFSTRFTVEDLRHKTYLGAVNAFEEKVSEWYLNVGDTLIHNRNSDFILTSICCVVIDLLSQYIYCKPASNKQIFRQFIEDYLSEFNFTITPPIKTCYFDKGRWIVEEIKDVAYGFYHCFRCGVVHSGRILEYGRISRENRQQAIMLNTWRHNGRIGREIVVNPVLLLKRLKIIFKEYLEELRDNSPFLKKNFIRKFRIEYGIEPEG